MTTGKIMIFFCFGMGLILALLPHLIWFLCWLCGKLSGNSISYAPFGWTALGLVIVFWSLMAYGYFAGRWKLEVNEIVYANHELPEAFEGFRIVHISDLHLNTFDDSPEQLERFVSSIRFTKDYHSASDMMRRPSSEEKVKYMSDMAFALKSILVLFLFMFAVGILLVPMVMYQSGLMEVKITPIASLVLGHLSIYLTQYAYEIGGTKCS